MLSSSALRLWTCGSGEAWNGAGLISDSDLAAGGNNRSDFDASIAARGDLSGVFIDTRETLLQGRTQHPLRTALKSYM